ncbi:MAG: inositol monophosphatase [Oscillospiraceae bacterium]|nr:inositol monophosphatase [Oscillospiraceae bacterium]
MAADAMRICEAIMAAEREAAELILHAHGVLAECKTGHRDVVTEYDRRVQQLLTERLGAALPGAKFFCEENDRQDELGAEHLFIIDPIDGTMNFVHRLNHSCISVAYARRGTVQAAAVYNPYVDEMFSAVRGGGAFLNGRPIRVDPAPLSESVVCVGTAPYREELTARTFALMERVCRASLDIRRQGSAALDLCSVAAGRAGLYFELSLSLWDYAAGALLVEEAGGRCLTVEGGPLPYDSGKPTILAGGARAVADFLALPEG